jgi:hypothetical protein
MPVNGWAVGVDRGLELICDQRSARAPVRR